MQIFLHDKSFFIFFFFYFKKANYQYGRFSRCSNIKVFEKISLHSPVIFLRILLYSIPKKVSAANLAYTGRQVRMYRMVK